LQGEVSDKFRFVTFCLQFATYLTEFTLCTFPDRHHFTTQQVINGVSIISFQNEYFNVLITSSIIAEKAFSRRKCFFSIKSNMVVVK